MCIHPCLIKASLFPENLWPFPPHSLNLPVFSTTSVPLFALTTVQPLVVSSWVRVFMQRETLFIYLLETAGLVKQILGWRLFKKKWLSLLDVFAGAKICFLLGWGQMASQYLWYSCYTSAFVYITPRRNLISFASLVINYVYRNESTMWLFSIQFRRGGKIDLYFFQAQ